MGCIFSHLYSLVFGNVDDAKVISKKIDKQILQELKNEPDEIDILILGAQEAGKSTLLKQVFTKAKRKDKHILIFIKPYIFYPILLLKGHR